jgi:hypothetical protein
MRPVAKGTAPRVYSHWGQARNDLATQIGWYCSYCEMGVSNMIEVEHIVPRNHGGAKVDWDNFLLSCKYCNTVKSNNNTSRTGYVWVDRDNTDLTYKYSEKDIIVPVANGIAAEAAATITLVGLNRNPGTPNVPTDADSRWIFRFQAWFIAKSSLENWNKKPSTEMAYQIALTAKGTGFYSIWMTVFDGVTQVQDAIRNEFPNTYSSADAAGNRVVRAGGII